MEALLVALVCITGALIPVARNMDRQDRNHQETTRTEDRTAA